MPIPTFCLVVAACACGLAAAPVDAQILIRPAGTAAEPITLRRDEASVQSFRPLVPATTTGGDCVALPGGGFPNFIAYYPSRTAATTEIQLWTDAQGTLVRAQESRSSVPAVPLPGTMSPEERRARNRERERITDRTTLVFDFDRDDAQATNARAGTTEQAIGAKLATVMALPGFEGVQAQLQRALSLCTMLRDGD